MGRVYVDQDLCTGDGLCEEIAPAVFFMFENGLAYVKDPETRGVDESGEPVLKGASGLATFSSELADAVDEAREECPGSCIFVEQEDGTFLAN